MDIHPTPFPVKSQIMNRKPARKSEALKADVKNRSLLPRSREKPVFGTVRNPNVPQKTVHEKLAKVKPSSRLPVKTTKPSQTIRSSHNIRAPIMEAKKLSEKTPTKLKKKIVCFQENEVKRNGKCLDDVNAFEPHTPVNAVITKPRVVTPFHSAERCSKCRFDKLETASYWLSQIKLAESVGKHSVSAAFFELAFDCNAEPIRNMRVELKKYLGRHGHLNEGVEWRKVTVNYGLVKEESRANGKEDVKAVFEEANASLDSHKDEDFPNQIGKEGFGEEDVKVVAEEADANVGNHKDEDLSNQIGEEG